MVMPVLIHGVGTAMCYLPHGLCDLDVAALYSFFWSSKVSSFAIWYYFPFSNHFLIGLILNDDNFWYLSIHEWAILGENIEGP